MNQSLPMYASCIDASTVKRRLNEADLFGRIANKKLFLSIQISANVYNRQKSSTFDNSAIGKSPLDRWIQIWDLWIQEAYIGRLWFISQVMYDAVRWGFHLLMITNLSSSWHHVWWSLTAGIPGFYGMKITWVRYFSEYSRHLTYIFLVASHIQHMFYLHFWE
jgi:hypothetical protein